MKKIHLPKLVYIPRYYHMKESERTLTDLLLATIEDETGIEPSFGVEPSETEAEPLIIDVRKIQRMMVAAIPTQLVTHRLKIVLHTNSPVLVVSPETSLNPL